MDTLTPGLSVTFKQLTLWDIDNAISSPELVDGPSHFSLPDCLDGLTPGPVPVPVSPTRPQGKVKGKKIPDISGPSGSLSSGSASLNTFLASKCQQLLGTDGSMEYSQTWKERATPGGRLYWEHTASGHRTSGNECSGDSGEVTGYPTPVAQPANGTPEDFLRRKRESVARGNSMGITLSDLNMVAQTFTGYPTPVAADDGHKATKHSNQPGMIGMSNGLITQSEHIATASNGVLDAAFSRWLMGFPEAWDEASPNYDSWRSVQEEIAQGDSKDMGTQ